MVENRYDFAELDDKLYFEVNGERMEFDVPPRGKKSFPRPNGDVVRLRHIKRATRFGRKKDMKWALNNLL